MISVICCLACLLLLKEATRKPALKEGAMSFKSMSQGMWNHHRRRSESRSIWDVTNPDSSMRRLERTGSDLSFPGQSSGEVRADWESEYLARQHGLASPHHGYSGGGAPAAPMSDGLSAFLWLAVCLPLSIAYGGDVEQALGWTWVQEAAIGIFALGGLGHWASALASQSAPWSD